MAITDQSYLQYVIETLGFMDSPDNRKFRWKLLIFLNIFSFFCINLVLLISEIFCYNDIFALADEMSQSFTVQLSCVKLFYFTWNETQYEKIYKRLQDIRRKYVQEDVFEQAVIKSRQLSPIITMVYIVCVRITSVGFMLLPTIIGLYTKFIDGEAVWGLPIKVRDEFFPSSTVPYIVSYLWHVHICHLVAGGAITMECLATDYQIKISALLKILQTRYRNISGSIAADERSFSRFRSVVNFHQEIIELENDLSALYQPIIFAQFVVTAVAVCVIGFLLLLGRSNWLETFILVAFAMGILFEPLIYSYSGERIIEESRKCADAVYESGWYRMSAKDRELVQIILMRSQKALKLNSPFYEINLATFARIINATFSYITLLRTILIEK